ncbi:sensory transduction histidine kinase [Methanosarcina sp. MTP4]|uniref:PocR ligand-binding domain-containing protein n=1 Tax=Methanosarcina sp. MTP4 TaxID=1434100 RepID=UPI000615700F|nr:PocR ligand-binding domain-containing protein [Methanosarcina sp. MTP4]AKB24880.1 sensory transduction histidine kinase [Methanosarcina sp. MTP4]
MGKKLTKSGIDVVGDIPWETHFCQFYRTKKDLLDVLIPYFKAGLENNEFCMWVTPPVLEVEEAKEALKRAVLDIDAYLDKGQVEIIPCAHRCVKEGDVKENVFDLKGDLSRLVGKLNEALEGGYEGLRLSFDSFWPDKKDWNDFIANEGELDLAAGNYRMLSLCTYSLNSLDATGIIHVVGNHSFALVNRDGTWERMESSRHKMGKEAVPQITPQPVTQIAPQTTKSWEHNNIQQVHEKEYPEFDMDSAFHQSGKGPGLKLESIPSSAQEKVNFELADIVDSRAIQSLMDDFYKLAHVPIGIIDFNGNVLVGVGWQDICTRFHRVHPEACMYCVESDTKLSTGVPPGEFKMYRCKNNMWDIATPIIVGGRHVGNIFLGQFFFEGELTDYELFRAQARKYGFNEEEYIAALKKVPRFSRETVNTIMSFFMKLANMLSQLGYSNIRLTRSLEEREELVDALRKSEERFRTLAENSPDLIARYDRQSRHMYVNPAAEEISGYPQEEIIGKNYSELGAGSEMAKFWEEHHRNVFATGKPETVEFQYISPQGKEYYFNTRIVPELVEGEVSSVLAISRDITDKKEAEARLKETLDNLEELVEERTRQLEQAYKSLKESEKGLAEAQRMAHIGNWSWNIKTDELFWSDEVYRIFGLNPQEFKVTYDLFLTYVHPEDLERLLNSINEGLNGRPYDVNYRIILADGEERVVHTEAEIIFYEGTVPVQAKGIVQDITERKMTEESMEKMEKFRIKEIHHRIKNNLQVISSLLSLQAETFRERDVLEAFKESQNRVFSMALIHEVLYKGESTDTLDFAAYLRKLTADLFRSYKLGSDKIKLNLDLEQVYLGMDTAIPLGIIVNELISNALKHAFPSGSGGEIYVNLCKNESFAANHASPGPDPSCTDKNGFHYLLTVGDNGKGIPEDIEFLNADSLGLQLVNILVEQIDGCIELKRDHGTKFSIWFSNVHEL